jgi:general secretion pathway protein F
MPAFHYKAVNGSGEVVEGLLDAPTQAAVIAQLNRSGLIPIRADHARPGWSLRDALRAFQAGRGIAPAHLAIFTRQLTMLLDAGLTLDRALQAVTKLTAGNAGRRIEGLASKVRSGASLAAALAAADVFPDYYVGMVEAGEASGKLNIVLHRLADHLESVARLRDGVKSALIYPAMVAVTCLGSLIVFIGYVLPQFESILVDAGAPVPTTTQMLLFLAAGIESYWWLLIILAAAVFLFVKRELRNPEIRYRADRLVLAVPLVGGIVRKTVVSRFTRTLSLLLENGVPLSGALGIAKNAITNAVLLRATETAARDVREGKSFSDSLMRTSAFPDLAEQLIKVGEESAHLAETLAKVADIFDWEVKQSLDRLVALMVPVLTIVLGIVVAGVVGSILSAMFSVYNIAA